MKAFSTDAWVGVFFIAFAVFVLFGVIPDHISVPGNVPTGTMSPQYWPKVICCMMLVLGAAQVLAAVIDAKSKANRNTGAPSKININDTAKIVGVVVLLFLYYWAVDYLGFLYSTMVFVPIMAFVYGERRIISLVLLCAIPGPALYLFFSRVAYTTFEPGKLFF